ncbi:MULTISPECIES: helix-turn-helix domain-containing protein [Laceyella]|uniref:Helix-turn-helix domain-containing protein n=2 Tax=Laceyella TaxID=292635 RepID=A0ABY5U320_LACSH|nr:MULTISPECIES: helix-turn-helix transcriptional regulator [Laceyella]PRZ16329.1 hypothetical protein CLV36_10237 [Laceyella sediminis]UWE03415.1 helix-turn-helix domain-containing protein [Laceyella sacchari]
MELTGKDLQIYRFAHGLTRQDLADRLEISYPYVALIERDECRIPKDRETDIRNRLGLSDYRLAKLRKIMEQLRSV